VLGYEGRSDQQFGDTAAAGVVVRRPSCLPGDMGAAAGLVEQQIRADSFAT
jgi:hypothetical protein